MTDTPEKIIESPYLSSIADLMSKPFAPTNFACIGPWQNFEGPPSTMFGWYRHFQTYITCRWYDSPFPWACNYDRLRGPNCFPAELDGIMSESMNGLPFHLRSKITAKYWNEYLDEHPERRALWKEFVHQYRDIRRLVCVRDPETSDGWTSVDERLPEPSDKRVWLVRNGRLSWEAAYFVDGRWESADVWTYCEEVTHYRPMPPGLWRDTGRPRVEDLDERYLLDGDC